MKLIPKINGDFLQHKGGLVVGGVATKVLGKKILASQSEVIKAGVPLVLGIVLGGQSNKLISGTGDGMVAVAGTSLVESLMPNLIGEDVMINQDVLINGQDFENFSSSNYDLNNMTTGEMGF